MNLTQWRKKNKLTMGEAAARLGVTQPTVSRIENGAQLPSSATIAKLHKNSDGLITAVDLFKAWQSTQASAA